MLRKLLFCCLALLAQNLYAQQTGFYGHVSDASTGEAVELALIYPEGREKMAVETDEQGYFELFMPFGKWSFATDSLRLHIRRVGYVEEVLTLPGPEAGAKIELKIALENQNSGPGPAPREIWRACCPTSPLAPAAAQGEN